MVRNKIVFAFGLLLIFFSCSDSGEDIEDIIETKDTVAPTITCTESITVEIEVPLEGSIVNYTTPVGKDNLPGVTTSQTVGLKSGSFFPVGTTTNTFLAIDAAGNKISCSFNVIITKKAPSSEIPYFLEENPAPTGKKWMKVENLSDEFNVDTFNNVKWKNTDPSSWIGRAPGLFKMNTVSQADGNLRLTADILPTPEVVNGITFTHAGSNITSIDPAEVGQYFECRMKANKTFMSSTFWLINKRNEGTGCDIRTIELDIQECVGEVTSTESWAQSTNKRMGSNTHSRNTNCTETPIGSVSSEKLLDGKATDNYHVYAAWWKGPKEIIFYLDGKKVKTVTPAADFNLKMYIKMVVETYDWNPAPAGGGMNGTAQDRTTYYDWVRTWKLIDN